MAHRFAPKDSTERTFRIALRRVATTASHIIQAHVSGSELQNEGVMLRLLSAYADSLGPWAARLSAVMIGSVSASNKKAFETNALGIGHALRKVLLARGDQHVVGRTAKLLQDRQVTLIKSIPVEAGIRAQQIARAAAMGGKRADEAAQELKDTLGVTQSRADLIARTEIAKANAALTQARAELVGVAQYQWETAEDADVRDSHKAMQGQVFRFDDPPTLEDGMTGNPGEFPNCRCFAVPMLPDN